MATLAILEGTASLTWCLIIAFVQFWREGHWDPDSEVGSLRLAKWFSPRWFSQAVFPQMVFSMSIFHGENSEILQFHFQSKIVRENA